MNKLALQTGLFALAILFSLTGMVRTSSAQTSVIVVPNTATTVEGNGENGLPFNLARFGMSSMRYQQVYAASGFASLSGPQRITQIAFRPDKSAGAAFSSTISKIQINLSTTSRAPDRLNSTFAANVGADDTVVFAGLLSLSSSNTGSAAGPKAFDMVIDLQTPFLYNPAAGNLLLDIRNFTGEGTIQFDAHGTSTDSVSRLYSLGSNNVNASFGQATTDGLVTQFTMIPEDITPPSVSVTGVMDGAVYPLGAVPSAACDTQDTGSGVATPAVLSVTGGTPNGVGAFTATCAGAIDNVGNAAAAVDVTYYVGYHGVSGILQPINPENTGLLSRGRSVPVKFQLAGDGMGTDFASGFETSGWTLERIAVNCTTFESADAQAVSVPSSTPSTVFRYDATSDQYIYNADFRGVPDGTCWKVEATLDDGVTILASAVFKVQR